MNGPLDRELNIRFVVGFAIVLTLITVGMAALMWGTSSFLRDRLEAQDPAPPALPAARLQRQPPGPHLQSDPEADLVQMRAEEARELSAFEWVDREAAIARVPIETAIELMAEDGMEATEN
ncbi:MAG: hypothetical protein ACE5GX_12940 [Thermoanaerobaculia bacterium]